MLDGQLYTPRVLTALSPGTPRLPRQHTAFSRSSDLQKAPPCPKRKPASLCFPLRPAPPLELFLALSS